MPRGEAKMWKKLSLEASGVLVCVRRVVTQKNVLKKKMKKRIWVNSALSIKKENLILKT